jgi:hypothetical protein
MELIVMTAVIPPSLIVFYVLFGLRLPYLQAVSPFKQPFTIRLQELPLGHV